MQRLKTITLAPAESDDNGIAQTQTPAAGGVQALNLNGVLVTAGVLNVDVPRRIAIASDGNDSGRTFTITGTSHGGDEQTETLVGPNTDTVVSLKDYGDGPIAITVDDDTAGAIIVGTNETVSSAWVPINRQNFNGVGVAVEITGVATYTVEHTVDDPFPAGVNVVGDPYLRPIPKPDLTGKTNNDEGQYDAPVTAVRLTLTAWDAGASVRMQVAPGGCG